MTQRLLIFHPPSPVRVEDAPAAVALDVAVDHLAALAVTDRTTLIHVTQFLDHADPRGRTLAQALALEAKPRKPLKMLVTFMTIKRRARTRVKNEYIR